MDTDGVSLSRFRAVSFIQFTDCWQRFCDCDRRWRDRELRDMTEDPRMGQVFRLAHRLESGTTGDLPGDRLDDLRYALGRWRGYELPPPSDPGEAA